jgi:hypothetical protein
MNMKLVLLAAFALGLSEPSYAVLINFDNVADGTVINNTYSGVTFNNPLGPADIYARSSSSAESPSNVVSVFQTGVPAFDARFGAVEAIFGSAQSFVSIDAAILRLPEGLGDPTNFPKLEIYNAAGFVTSVGWNFGLIPQPPAGAITGYETLSYTSTANDITKVRFLSGLPGGAPSNFGYFDNFVYNQNGTPSIPEPASMALMSLGLGVLAWFRRRNVA